jgi:hypothetical protein
MLQEKMDEEYLRIDEGGFPHVPLLKCPYYYGIFVKRAQCDGSGQSDGSGHSDDSGQRDEYSHMKEHQE